MPDDNASTKMTAADKLNAKIERRISTRDYLEALESAYVEYPTVINSPVIKRVYIRFFDATQLNVHRISVYGRIGLREEQVVQVEDRIRKSLEDVDAYLNEKLRESEALFQANGITTMPRHLAPKEFRARVISPLSRKFLNALIKADQVVGMIELLVIEDLIKTTRGEMLIAEVRNRLRKIAVGARTLALGVRKMVETATAAAAESVTNGRPPEPEPVEPDSHSPELPADLPSSTDTAKEALPIAARETKAERAKRKAAKADATDVPSLALADEPVPTEQAQPLAVAVQQTDARTSA